MEPKKGILAVVDDLIAEVREEFVTHFKTVIQLVKDLKETNVKEFNSMRQYFTKTFGEMKSEMSSGVSMSKKDLMSYCEKEMSKMYSKYEKMYADVDIKMNLVQDGLDGKDADEKRITEEVLSKIPPAPFLTSIEIRDRLEILTEDERLDIKSIKGIEELEKKINTGGGVRGGARGVMLYVDGTKQGQASMINLIPGTGVSLTYSRAYGRNDITINASSAALAILTATGDIDGVNTDYTFVSKPNIIILNGASYRENAGWTWTAGTLTATMASAPIVGSDLYAL